ncbi:hypothetical protein COCOR_01875 [Corallococcus coralloides DSM 2259]|uniref:eCIS core domain-containing protein n=1 Tax=Corallococcus coralloides (strain ATCC 25202 / DSM 2259 / NBRC 100086 / M2) TaxID=1144275 RepID=H8MEY6_CORCM|nr:DUF4157 domain-containing protein [Corallococcus coralloides]AFE04347.1 hypothetical protein COCOR_01875 [Corallococcus coralloides DSM 2259]
MSGVKAQTTREAVHARSTSSVGPRFDARQDLEAERAKVRDILDTGQTLAPATRHSMESAFGTGFGDVRVHTSPEAGGAARALGARAFTVGTDIVFGAGNYRPGVPSGERLIAHELAHVVQQRSAGVSGLAAFPESVSTPSHPAEVEAERAASLAVNGLPVPRLTPGAGAVMRDVSMNLDAGPEADVVPVRPTARTNRQMVVEGREAVANALDPKQRHLVADLTHLIVSGQDVLWFDANGKRKGTFAMRPDAVIWATGYYLAMESELVRLVEQKNERWWAPWSFENAKTGLLLNWLQPAEAKRFQAEVAPVGSLVALVGIPETKPADDSSAGDAANAERLVAKVRERIARSVAAKEGDGGTSTPGGEGKGVPDRLVVWSDERGPFVNVWADGVCKVLPLSDGETEEALQSRVEEATEELRESRDAANSTKVAKGAKQTGFTGKDGQFVGGALPADVPRLAGARNVANTLPYPAKIANYGPEITVTGSSSRFEMMLDYTSAGSTTLDQVGARMQPITYFWDIFDVTDMQPESRGDMRNAALSSANQLSRTDAIARDFGRKMDDIAEDTAADVDDATSGSALSVVATWPARSAWLGVVGLSNVVRFGKASISSYIDLVTTPRSEQGVGWDHEGEFLIRCVASPQFDDDSPVRRASSVAAVVVKVMDVNQRATQVNDQNLAKLRRLEALRDQATGEERDGLDAQIAALRRVETASVAELGGDARTAIEERIAVANQLAADRKGSVARDSRTPASRLLDAQLELQGIPLEEYQQQLAQQKEQVGQRLQLIGKVGARIPGANFRPAVTLVSEENGQVHELVMMLGEAAGSREGARHYLLADVTAPSPKDRYVFEGRSSQAGTKGHAEAVRKAFVDFRENNGYGRGTLALRLPKALEDAAGGPLGLEPRMRSAPGTRGRVMQRLTDLATVAEIAGLFLTGPAGLAVGLAGGLAGAVVAVDSLSRRHSAGALQWDFQTIMDVSAIVGGVAAVAAPALSALRNAPRWAKRVERLQGILHIYGVTQLGSTVIVIPYQLEMELAELEKLQGQLSPGQLAARRAEAILGAVRSGLMTAGSAVQMLHPPDAGGSPHAADSEDGLATRPAEGEPRVSTPDEVMEPVSREAHEARAPGDEGPLPVDAAGPTARPPAKSERVTALELELGDLQGKVAVVEVGPPELKGRSTRVRYRKGRVQIEVGPEAGPHQIRTHVETARLLRRYEGPIGHIRRLLSRLVQAVTRIAGDVIPAYGTLGFESRLEVRKLNRIISELESLHAGIDERIQKVGDKEGSALAREKESVQRDIAELELQLEHYERLVDSLEAGRGYVAAEYDAATKTTLSTVKGDLATLRTALEKDGKLSIVTKIIDQAALLQQQGRMTGVEAWVQNAVERDKTPRLLEQRLSELSGAVKQALLSPADLVALVSPPSGSTAPFTTSVTAGGGRARRQIGEREKAARQWFSEDQVAAFDLWADLQVSRGINLEKALDTSGGKGLKEPAVRGQVDSMADSMTMTEQAHRHVANLVGDPLRPDLPYVRTEKDVRIISGTKQAEMRDFEIEQASELHQRSKEAVVLFASDAAGNSFPGIDGTIGSPPRAIQLKYLPTSADASAARSTAMGALERARNAGFNDVEVYIKSDGKEMKDVQAGWGGPLSADGGPRTVGDVFENQIIKLIEIQCSNGVLRVELVNGTYVFKTTHVF